MGYETAWESFWLATNQAATGVTHINEKQQRGMPDSHVERNGEIKRRPTLGNAPHHAGNESWHDYGGIQTGAIVAGHCVIRT